MSEGSENEDGSKRLPEKNGAGTKEKFQMEKGQNLTFAFGSEDKATGLDNARARGNKTNARCFRDEESSAETGARLLQSDEEYDVFTLGVAIVNLG